MAVFYGVLRGKVDVFKREDKIKTPHLQIRLIDGNNALWRVPVNVLSQDKSFLILHRVDPLLSHPILGNLPQVATGFSAIPGTLQATATNLDYFRSPLFDWASGIAIPDTGPAANDDLQDTLVTYLTQLKAQNGELFVFGAKFPEPGQHFDPSPIDNDWGTTQGVHDIHMNQGNPHGSHDQDNGVFQDGGLILKFPGRFVGIFLRFQSQLLPTDDTGNPTPDARPIPAGGSPVVDHGPVTPPPVLNPTVYIERALVNPFGEDPGREIVVLGNTTTVPVDLNGWRILDRNNKVEVISHLTLAPGASEQIKLSGNGAQLGNGGGTIRLMNAAGDQIHAVTYSQNDAQEPGRFIRFNT